MFEFGKLWLVKYRMKRALLIGIRYFGSPCELYGCINDIDDMKAYLGGRGYTQFTILEDRVDDPGHLLSSAPTRANILAAFQSAIAITGPRDTLYIHYSGHGSQAPDQNGDEADGLDECIVPVDYESAGMIIDDELRALIDQLPAGAALRVFFDACHSGSALDLPRRWIGGHEHRSESRTAPRCTDIVFISGCRDSQYSSDAEFSGRPNGAMTQALLTVLAKITPRHTWVDLVLKMRKKLAKAGFDQVPQLSYVEDATLTRPAVF